jgi:single-strand DNA-binding protein
MNKAELIGRLGADPEVRFLQDGRPVANIRIATDMRWKDKNGETQKKTEWHRVVFYGSLAETASDYLKTGRLIYVEGPLSTRKWTDKEGIDRYTTEIIGRRMEFLDNSTKANAASKEAASVETPPIDDEVPF